MPNKRNYLVPMINFITLFLILSANSYSDELKVINIDQGTIYERSITHKELIGEQIFVFSPKDNPKESRFGVVEEINSGFIQIITDYGIYSDHIENLDIITKDGYQEYKTNVRPNKIKVFGENSARKYIPKNANTKGLYIEEEYLVSNGRRIPLDRVKLLSDELSSKARIFDFIIWNNPEFNTASTFGDIKKRDLVFANGGKKLRGGLEFKAYVGEGEVLWVIKHRGVIDIDKMTEFGFLTNEVKYPALKLNKGIVLKKESKALPKYGFGMKMYFESDENDISSQSFEVSEKTYLDAGEIMRLIE